MKLSEAVGLYIQLRDKKAQLKAEYEDAVGPVQAKLDALEAKLLEVFNKTGTSSVKTEAGTAYASVRTSASVADREVFMNFVKNNGEWGLLEVRASKTAVDEYRSSHDDQLPPGVNLREERVVNIRRSA